MQVATYKTDSDTLEIQYNLGDSDAIQCSGQCSDCSYQYKMQVHCIHNNVQKIYYVPWSISQRDSVDNTDFCTVLHEERKKCIQCICL